VTAADDWGEFSPPDVVREPSDRWPTFDLTYAVETGEGGRKQCTVFPQTASDADVVTRWITADEEDYVSFEEIR
jgi:hypothetical protein